MKTRIVFSVVMAVITAAFLLSSEASYSGYNTYTNTTFNFFGYGSNQLPIVLVRSSYIEKDIKDIEAVAKSFGATQFKVDTDYLKPVLERRFGKSFDGRKLHESFVDNYTQTIVTYASKKTSPVCLVRVGNDPFEAVAGEISLVDKLIIAHEAAHCPQLSSFLKRDSYQEALPGVLYLRNGEIVDQYEKGNLSRREAVFKLKYSEYIREVSADIASLMYLKHVANAKPDEITTAIEHLKAKRKGENINLYPNSVGHYTVSFLEMIEQDLGILDRYKSMFMSDSFLAAMSIAYEQGKEHSFTFQNFYRKYGYLDLSTELL